MNYTNFDEINQKKSKAEKLIIIGFFGIIPGFSIFFLVPEFITIGIALLVAGIIMDIVGYAQFSNINTSFKATVLPNLVSEIIENGHYNPNSGLSTGEVYSTGFLKRADRFHSEDLITGELDTVSFKSSDVKLEEKHVVHTKDGTRTEYVTYFLGRVFIFEFNKKFKGTLQVLESGRPQISGNFQKVELESVDFNKKFNTYSTDEHSAFYVLTPHFMESLMIFEKENRGNIGFSFIGNKLYIGLDNRTNTFELRLFTKVSNETIDRLRRELNVVKEIVSELRLNNKIFI